MAAQTTQLVNHSADVTRVFGLLDPQPQELNTPSRRFLKEGEITQISEDGKENIFYAFLFNDVFLLTSKAGAKFSLKFYIPLQSGTTVEDAPDNRFKLVTSSKKTFVFSLSATDGQVWKDGLVKQIKDSEIRYAIGSNSIVEYKWETIIPINPELYFKHIFTNDFDIFYFKLFNLGTVQELSCEESEGYLKRNVKVSPLIPAWLASSLSWVLWSLGLPNDLSYETHQEKFSKDLTVIYKNVFPIQGLQDKLRITGSVHIYPRSENECLQVFYVDVSSNIGYGVDTILSKVMSGEVDKSITQMKEGIQLFLKEKGLVTN